MEKALQGLPPDPAVLLYLDIVKAGPDLVHRIREAARRWGNPESAGGAGTTDNGWDLFCCAGTPPPSDIDALAFAAGEDYRVLWFDGRFTEPALRGIAAASGIECGPSLLDTPCVLPASHPGRRLLLSMPDERTLKLSESPADQDEPTRRNGQPRDEDRLSEARRAFAGGAFAWAALVPARLTRTLGVEAVSGRFLELFTRALGPARVAHLSLQASESSGVELHLRARFETPEDARRQVGLVEGLSAFGAAMIGPRGGSSNPWNLVLRGGRFRREAREAYAVWPLEALFGSSEPDEARDR